MCIPFLSSTHHHHHPRFRRLFGDSIFAAAAVAAIAAAGPFTMRLSVALLLLIHHSCSVNGFTLLSSRPNTDGGGGRHQQRSTSSPSSSVTVRPPGEQSTTTTTTRSSALGASTATTTDSSKTKEVDCLVVGSGVSGATLAFNLVHNQKITNLLLVDANPVVGGNLISRSNEDGFVWEEGPNSFQPTSYICRLVHELGLTNDLVLADGTLPRFVYWRGEGAGTKLANLHALPTNLPGDLLTFNLLTWPGKIRAALGAIGLVAPGPTPESGQEESIREFVTRHLGAETFERVIDPFVSGVYAGDPDALSMKAALKKIHRLEELGVGPGLVPGAVARFQELAAEQRDNPADPAWPTYRAGQLGSFRKGLQTLAFAVEDYLGPDRVWKNSPVTTILREPDGRYKVTIATKKGDDDEDKTTTSTSTVLARSVCVTSPTRVTCKIAADLIPAAKLLEQVYSPPVASVTMAYKKEWFKDLPGASPPNKPLVGFGHLLPRKMGVRSLGTIWSSSLFPGRAPDGWELLLTYIGGARDTGIADMTLDEIYDQVDKDNHQILLRDDAPAGRRLGCRVWPTAIPQYRRGHLDILVALERDEAKCPGLYLGGNYRTGVAFGDCVQFGYTEAAKVAQYLAATTTTTTTTKSPATMSTTTGTATAATATTKRTTTSTTTTTIPTMIPPPEDDDDDDDDDDEVTMLNSIPLDEQETKVEEFYFATMA